MRRERLDCKGRGGRSPVRHPHSLDPGGHTVLEHAPHTGADANISSRADLLPPHINLTPQPLKLPDAKLAATAEPVRGSGFAYRGARAASAHGAVLPLFPAVGLLCLEDVRGSEPWAYFSVTKLVRSFTGARAGVRSTFPPLSEQAPARA